MTPQPTRCEADAARADAIRRAVTDSAVELLRTSDSDRAIRHVLERVGGAIGGGRISLRALDPAHAGDGAHALRPIWTAPAPNRDDDVPAQEHTARLATVTERLARGEAQVLRVHELAPAIAREFQERGIASVLVVPVFVGGDLWGQLELEERRRDRHFARIEIDALRAVADLIGATLERARTVDEHARLASRESFFEELGRAFEAARRGAPPFAIHFIDLDAFKDINEVMGHAAGDRLLRMVGERLRGLVRPSDLAARLGGDEFAVLQSGIADAADAGVLATQALQALAEPYDLGAEVQLTASIGIAVYTPRSVDPGELLRQAEIALYRGKDSGRNTYHIHSDALDAAVVERVTLTGDLRRALDRGELELYYQPQVEILTGAIVGLEALARWQHPQRGTLLPKRFIPIAEKTGLIVALGGWAIQEVCRQIVAWRAEGLHPPKIAVNISGVQLKAQPTFHTDLAATLRAHRILPQAIELELTESVLMETRQRHSQIIDRLHELGVATAIDDFGTGYSSLEYLRAHRVSHIKIAQEFVRDLRPDSGDLVIVRAAVGLARDLGMDAIAEGVETQFQRDYLAEIGCRYAQGFYFSPPVPAAEAAQLLRRGRLEPAPAAAPASPPTEQRP